MTLNTFKQEIYSDYEIVINDKNRLHQIVTRTILFAREETRVEEVDVDETGNWQEDACRVRERAAYKAALSATDAAWERLLGDK